MKEVWKDIINYPNYQVSNMGNVRRKTKKGYHLLKPNIDKYGYAIVNLSCMGKQKTHSVHRLVAMAFIDNPDNLPQVNHKDECKTNNAVYNLEWCTAKYNIRYSKSKAVFGYNGFQILEYDAISDAEKDGFIASAICQAINKGGCHGGFMWQYKMKDGEINPLLETLKFRYQTLYDN